jgi:hypothetical protein
VEISPSFYFEKYNIITFPGVIEKQVIGAMAFSRIVDKTHIMCLCEGWMLFPARSNLLHGQEIASSGEERPPRNDTPFLEKAIL